MITTEKDRGQELYSACVNQAKQLIDSGLSGLIVSGSDVGLYFTEDMFKEAGYELHVLNLADMERSDHYNPFHNIRTSEQVHDISARIITALNGDSMYSAQRSIAETALLEAVILYFLLFQKREYFNLPAVASMIQYNHGADPNKRSSLDFMFKELSGFDVSRCCLDMYRIANHIGRGLKPPTGDILDSKLSCFRLPGFKKLSSSDDMKLDRIGDKEAVYFVICPKDSRFRFFANLFIMDVRDRVRENCGITAEILDDPLFPVCVFPSFAHKELVLRTHEESRGFKPVNKPENMEENSQHCTPYPLKGIILSERYMLQEKETNQNILVAGGPGAGKSSNFVIPNLLQARGSYIVADPCGKYAKITKTFFEGSGYKVRVFDPYTGPEGSVRYDPFRYLRSRHDVCMMVECLVSNTGNPIACDGTKIILEAVLAYVMDFFDYDKNVGKGFKKAFEFLSAGSLFLDRLFEEAKKVRAGSFCVNTYDLFKEKVDINHCITAENAINEAAALLKPFTEGALKDLVSADETELNLVGDIPSILFVVTRARESSSPEECARKALAVMALTQAADTLISVGSDNEKPGLKEKPMFILDYSEPSGSAVIPGLAKKLSKMEQYGLSCAVLVQSMGQLEQYCGEVEKKTIQESCGVVLYFGNDSILSAEEINDAFRYCRCNTSGREDETESAGVSGSRKIPLQIPEKFCFIGFRDSVPFPDKKYETKEHPNAGWLEDAPYEERMYTFHTEGKTKKQDGAEEIRR